MAIIESAEEEKEEEEDECVNEGLIMVLYFKTTVDN